MMAPSSKSYQLAPFQAEETGLTTISEGNSASSKKVAVLILDFQNEFVSEGGKLHGDVKDMLKHTGMLQRLPKFVTAARDEGALIIHAPVIMKAQEHLQPGDWDPHSYAKMDGLFVEGTWGCSFAKGIDQLEKDVILKNRNDFDAYKGTNLASVLEERSIGFLFVGGFLSNLCVEETCRTASEKDGLSVFVLTDGCTAKTEEEHFAATTGTLPLFTTPVTCTQAESIMKEKKYGSPELSFQMTGSKALRSSLIRRNSSGARRNTFLNAARHSAYLKALNFNEKDENLRMSISTIMNYYPEKEEPDEKGFDPASTIFFMVGSQRSGSNWLRTMLSEREDLAGPHPPHILRDFFPILDKFGNLEDEENLEILVDHVCTFVETNQVPWLDKHGRKIRFDRERILDVSVSTINILRHVKKDEEIGQQYYLIAIFDEIMNLNAIQNDSRTWICKSMGNSQFHDMLLTYYGEERLRYIYLVRDPRDVAMSFMKTPVGDCHYYAIAKKWAKLQGHALHVLSVSEDLVHQVRYEQLLQNNEQTMKEINDFMGKRKFGKVLRRGSVAILKKVEDMMEGATGGVEAKKASVLSYQFQNLTRGASFRKQQFQKWRKGLSDEEIHLIESVVLEMMTRLGYEPNIVGVTADRLVFTDEQIAEFSRLNEEGIKKMHEDLAVENPEDLKRRQDQAAILRKSAKLLSQGVTEDSDSDDEEECERDKIAKWPKGAGKHGYLPTEDVIGRFEIQEGAKIPLPDGRSINYSVVMQRGYYPSDLDKECQDSYLVGNHQIDSKDISHWLCVFDGHGPTGHKCARYVRDELVKQYKSLSSADNDLDDALAATLLKVNKGLHESDIDDSHSGTTALTVLFEGQKLHIANVGDCRCIIVSQAEDGTLKATALTCDQTPHRKDELERIKKAGGLVMTSEQYDHEEPMHEEWLDGDSPPRIWSKDGKFPGCAFTRSIGDNIGESVGVIAEAEFSFHTLSEKDKMVILGSDGIFEFITDKEVTVIASQYSDPSEVCRALVGESYKRWVKREERTDDITVIAGFIE